MGWALKDHILQFKQISAFQDNYIWAMMSNGLAWVVDPGSADPVIKALKHEKCKLAGILITHHHNDHIGGIQELLDWVEPENRDLVPVVGPINEEIPFKTIAVIEGDELEIFPGIVLQVLEVPGHTIGHVAYVLPVSANNPISRVFCGDTLFASGCGRIFEGTATQMNQSLAKLSALPSQTYVYCAHEYTLSNIRFAQAVEPSNPNLIKWHAKANSLRQSGESTVPTTLELELQVNPFLRCSEPSVIESASKHAGQSLHDPVAVFAELRSWKDGFK